ncbi:GAF domain-containing protein [Xanthocytophaga flava]|uniref:GAF domain-containing protein n=1 Tax=Xanthocytophaga flava TaxID=3048013 RepID=UPI0028D58D60|nr:GAF domain-containing protein [Xanthocytophaga flavus]MDJ1471818.1 GAF domain-containing protein [Xanthocytophaga flavus]
MNLNSQLVDVAGRNRMLSQRIAAFSLLATSATGDMAASAKEELSKALTLHISSVKVLKEGGVPAQTETYMLFPPASPQVLAELNEVETLLSDYQDRTKTLTEADVSVETKKDSATIALASIQMQKSSNQLGQKIIKGALLVHNQKVVSLLVQQAEITKTNFNIYLLFLLLVNVSLLGGVYWAVKQLIGKPIEEISTISDRIADGDLSRQIAYESADEMGRIARSINLLISDLKNSAAFVNEIEKGNLEATYKVKVNDQITVEDNLPKAILQMRDRLRQISIEDARRNWLNEGLAQFNEVIRTQAEDLNELSLVLIRQLIKYLPANQGGIYLFSGNMDRARGLESGAYLELLACVAFNRRKYIDQRVPVEEGLLGSCVLEGQSILLTQIPHTYLRITSGLGEETPACLLLVPLFNNRKEVIGVIELASFEKFESHQQDFVERLSEMIGSTFQNVRNAQETKHLLAQTQQLSEEMKAQEEELRQNLEELMATQEEMRRRESQNQKEPATQAHFVYVKGDGMMKWAKKNQTT